MHRERHRDPAPPCFVCDVPGWGGKLVYGPTPSKDRRLCPARERQGFTLDREEDFPYRGTLTTPEGVKVAYNLRDPKPAGKTKLRRLRDEDTSKIPGTEGLFLRKGA